MLALLQGAWKARRISSSASQVAIHPICHRMLHATFTNKELERLTLAQLRTAPKVAPFLAWIAAKEPDFSAPTRRKR